MQDTITTITTTKSNYQRLLDATLGDNLDTPPVGWLTTLLNMAKQPAVCRSLVEESGGDDNAVDMMLYDLTTMSYQIADVIQTIRDQPLRDKTVVSRSFLNRPIGWFVGARLPQLNASAKVEDADLLAYLRLRMTFWSTLHMCKIYDRLEREGQAVVRYHDESTLGFKIRMVLGAVEERPSFVRGDESSEGQARDGWMLALQRFGSGCTLQGLLNRYPGPTYAEVEAKNLAAAEAAFPS